MGYTHYWRRPKVIENGVMERIVNDFRRLLPELNKYMVLAGGYGEGEPKFTIQEVWFNGASKCGHPQNEAISIPWPSKKAGGIAEPWREDVQSGHWFAGAEIDKRVCNGDCSYETFYFPQVIKPGEWQKPENGLYFACCKTAFRPYDLAVISFLIVAKYFLGERIKVSSDGEDCHWFDGKMLCQVILGYGLEYSINKEGELVQGAISPSGGVIMSKGWPICDNCSKRDCKRCSLAVKSEPERIKSIVPRVLDNIGRQYEHKEGRQQTGVKH